MFVLSVLDAILLMLAGALIGCALAGIALQVEAILIERRLERQQRRLQRRFMKGYVYDKLGLLYTFDLPDEDKP